MKTKVEVGDIGILEEGAYRVPTTFGEGSMGAITFMFKDIERARANEVNANVDALCHLPGEPSWSFRARLNLLSLSGREAYARALTRPVGKNADFPADIALGNAIDALVRRLDNRDDSLWLEEAKTDEASTWLLEPLILDRSANVLFGKGGGGKTYITLRIALSLATGLPFLGMKPARTCKTLFLDYEDEPANLADRMWRIAGSTYAEFKPELEAIREKIRYVRAGGIPIHDLALQLKKLIHLHGIELLIVDSAALACGGEPEKAESAIRYFNAIAKLGIATITIAHETKSENHDYVFGSVFFHNSARNIWNVQVDHETDDERIVQIGLFHRKCNHGGLRRAIPVRMFHGEGFVDIGSGDWNLWEKELSVSDRILRRLNERGMTRSELERDLTGVDTNSIKVSLQRLQKSGRVELFEGQGGIYKRTKPITKTEIPEGKK